MPLKVAAFSQFAALPDFRQLREPLRAFAAGLGLKGSVRLAGTYVDPSDWNALIASPDTLVIDTRNAFEVAMGTFEGALDPGIKSFGQFKDFAAERLDSAKDRKIAMFCTGG